MCAVLKGFTISIFLVAAEKDEMLSIKKGKSC